uniref:M14 protein n=1 Tax=Ceratopteris richardii TaxID=49495 RepID=G0KY93_CERRI|nr:M14 protein [Ceratopteris richardii]
MGRVKLEIRKIENPTNRQVTYSKRRNGLIKKAYELSVLCDIDIALIMFSPSGRLNHFSGKKRIEDVIARFANLSDHERAKSQCLKWCNSHNLPPKIANSEMLMRAAKRLKQETYMAIQLSSSCSRVTNLETLQYEIQRTQVQLQDIETRLRIYEGDLKCMHSMEQLDSLEQHLQTALESLRIRKRALDQNTHLSMPLDSARAQIYGIMQSQPGGMLQHATPAHIWLSVLRDYQIPSTHNMAEHPNSILSLRDCQDGDCPSASSSLYSRTLCHVSDMQGTAPEADHSGEQQAMPQFRAGQIYQVDSQSIQEVEGKVEGVDCREHKYSTTKVDSQTHPQREMDVNAGTCVSSSSDWQSAFHSVHPSSIAPATSPLLNPISLRQHAASMGMMLAHQRHDQQSIMPFASQQTQVEPAAPRSMLNDVDSGAIQMADGQNVLSLATSFGGSSYN